MATVDSTTANLPPAGSRAGQLGMYAGFVTRAAALMLDIVLLTVAVLVIIVAAVTHDITPGTYILAVLLKEQAADLLVQNLARRAPILVSRCTIAVDAITVSIPATVQSS